jgi:hypothetical protein
VEIYRTGANALRTDDSVRFAGANTEFGSSANTSYFDSNGNLFVRDPNASVITMIERATDASAPAANNGVIYARDNGSGKTQFVARFASGAVQVIATEP